MEVLYVRENDNSYTPISETEIVGEFDKKVLVMMDNPADNHMTAHITVKKDGEEKTVKVEMPEELLNSYSPKDEVVLIEYFYEIPLSSLPIEKRQKYSRQYYNTVPAVSYKLKNLIKKI